MSERALEGKIKEEILAFVAVFKDNFEKLNFTVKCTYSALFDSVLLACCSTCSEHCGLQIN